MDSVERAEMRKLEERLTDYQGGIQEARDAIGEAIAFADPHSVEDAKHAFKKLRDAEKILRPYDHRVSENDSKEVDDADV